MNGTLRTIIAYQFRDALKSRWMLHHTLIYFVAAEALVLMAGSGERAMASLVNVVLLLVPLGALVFGAMHLYSIRDFLKLLLTQPMDRGTLFTGVYLGLALPESVGLALALGAPFLLHGFLSTEVLAQLGQLILLAVALTWIFTALALLIATHVADRVRCVGTALAVWLLMSVAYDGLILVAVEALSRYPLEKPLLALMLLNPVDLSRVLLMLALEAEALMGYTGAVFSRYLGGFQGLALAGFSLLVWLSVPFMLTRRAFARHDF
ncbi:MAG: ABC transporter permease subunit [Rhodothermales bacterium]|nr:ABC transporter permease subunit [Rhodothermales bacterium]MBO6780022.1 ABC transporter permease subunit [Rhodothermales bacterium]